MLSGAARNACRHCVLAARGSEARASLNLRFGEHDADDDADAEFSVAREMGALAAPTTDYGDVYGGS